MNPELLSVEQERDKYKNLFMYTAIALFIVLMFFAGLVLFKPGLM